MFCFVNVFLYFVYVIVFLSVLPFGVINDNNIIYDRSLIRLQFRAGERAHRGLSDRAQQRDVLRHVGLQRQRAAASHLLVHVHARRTHQPHHRQPTARSAPEPARRPDGNSALQEEQYAPVSNLSIV